MRLLVVPSLILNLTFFEAAFAHHDTVWDTDQLAIVPIGMKKSEAVKNAVESLYAELQQAGIEVLLDDRDERPGVMFADMELIGIPHRIVVGERGLKEG